MLDLGPTDRASFQGPATQLQPTMSKLQVNHTHRVEVSLAPSTHSFLERLLPDGQAAAVHTLSVTAHILPLLDELYSKARSRDGVSRPANSNTTDRASFVTYHRLVALLGSMGIRLLFPTSFDRPDVKVERAEEDESVDEPTIVSIDCPGLYCERTKTIIEPALVGARVPAQSGVAS